MDPWAGIPTPHELHREAVLSAMLFCYTTGPVGSYLRRFRRRAPTRATNIKMAPKNAAIPAMYQMV